MSNLFRLLFILSIIMFSFSSMAAPKDGFCQNFQQVDIPVGDFQHGPLMPELPLRVTQHYNTTKAEGYCIANGTQLDAASPSCSGQKIYFGHDGLDLHPLGAAAGQTDVFSVQPGIVVASHPTAAFAGWGESIIIATRPNSYSEEIITFHYHHLYYNQAANLTSRLYGACDQVEGGKVIAKEGGTPSWPSHLHFGVKRWDSLRQLKNQINNNPIGFYGPGYSFGNNAKLSMYLNPLGLLTGTFLEFNEHAADYSAWQWAELYAREMRNHGWEFGLFDGNFGADREVRRKDAARWIKQALRLSSVYPSNAHFSDVPLFDSANPYVEALIARPVSIQVISPDHGCNQSGTMFCPDSSLTRAEALKMIVAGFYQEEFLDTYTNWIWNVAAPLADNLLSQIPDVAAYSWYAPYVYFAIQNGLTGSGAAFSPNLPIRRAELAKWLVVAEKHRFNSSSTLGQCHVAACPMGKYCDQLKGVCQSVPSCLPLEDHGCSLGGGYLSTQAGGNADSGQNGNIQSPVCLAGQEQLALCPGATGGAYRICLSSNQWSEWNPPCFSSGQVGTAPADAGIPDAGVIPPVDSGVSDGSGSTPACIVSYYLSSNGSSCYSNPGANGSPTLCLETKNPIGKTANWRLCKQGGTFQSAFTYQLLDQNHLSHWLSGTNVGSPGISCTPWQQSDFSYLTQNSPVNGAGLIIEVHSPSGCLSSNCIYYTGMTTLYRECQ